VPSSTDDLARREPATATVAARADPLVLAGGPLQRFGRRLGLIGGDSNSVPLGFALGGSLWGVLLLLSWIDGVHDSLFSLSAIGVHVRLLVALPLLFVAETLVTPCVATFIESLVRSGVVTPRSQTALDAELARARRLAYSWWPELLCLVGALAMLLAGSHLHLHGGSATPAGKGGPVAGTLAGLWYAIVCLTVVRFCLLRWLWRMLLWCRFLRRLSTLDLHLVPTHPDRQAGLGYLQVVHSQFMPVVVAISAIQAAGLAEEIAQGTTSLEAVAPAIVLLVAVMAVLFLGPLLILAPQLRAARLSGLARYMELGSTYVNAFETKWIMPAAAPGESILGSADVQSLADMQSSVGMVDEMRWIPVSLRLAMFGLGATLVPMTPLLLFKYPIAELAHKLVGRLVGN
jgi:hypothetical protein